MAHLIDKDVLVAEIEKRRKAIPRDETDKRLKAVYGNEAFVLNDLLSFLDTLEVKEVDLEKYYHDFLQKEWFGNSHVRTVSEMMAFTAKHFFELGLKTQKGK